MPECPEVESARTSVEKYCLGSSVVAVVAVEQGGGPRDGMEDEKVCLITEGQIKSAMLHHNVDNVCRKGKHFWIEFSSGESLLFHFGMTGSIAFQNKPVSAYKAFKVSSSWPPKFTKIMISFSNGEKLAFCDPRRLGRIRMIKNPRLSPPISTLAPDPLIDGITADQFSLTLSKYSSPIKSILLDQEKLCCGIGNWVADEVLFQSGIHPESPCNAIASHPPLVERIVNTICSVLQQAVNANANDSAFPSDWLFHKRWGKGKAKKGEEDHSLTLNGDAITFITVGGRTSAVVLCHQQKITSNKHFKTEKISKKQKVCYADDTKTKRGMNRQSDTTTFVSSPPSSTNTKSKSKKEGIAAKVSRSRSNVKDICVDDPSFTITTRSKKRKADM